MPIGSSSKPDDQCGGVGGAGSWQEQSGCHDPSPFLFAISSHCLSIPTSTVHSACSVNSTVGRALHIHFSPSFHTARLEGTIGICCREKVTVVFQRLINLSKTQHRCKLRLPDSSYAGSPGSCTSSVLPRDFLELLRTNQDVAGEAGDPSRS